MHKLGLLGRRAPDLSKWRSMVERILHPHGKVKIARRHRQIHRAR